MQDTIIDKLHKIERDEQVTILFAVESGSRAWELASSDSDYDVRFVYVRRRDDYLRLSMERDVLEYPISNLLDINGWDLKKALLLLNKSNPSILEWLSSPMIYMQNKYLALMQELVPVCFDKCQGLYHYVNMARNNYKHSLLGDEVKVKKYFYCLRPILCCEWILEHQSQPPLSFNKLMDAHLPPYLKEEVTRLLDIKVNTQEIKVIERIDAINQYISESIERVSTILENSERGQKDHLELLDPFFVKVVNECERG